MLAVANLHLPCSLHSNSCPKLATTSSDLSSLKAYLLHLPLLYVAIWWIDQFCSLVHSGLRFLAPLFYLPTAYLGTLFDCFQVMPFVFCETDVNAKKKVLLFHLINLFAHLLPNNLGQCIFMERGIFYHFAIAIIAGLSLTFPSDILWEIRAGCPLLKFPVGAKSLHICELCYFPLCVKCQVCLIFQGTQHNSRSPFLSEGHFYNSPCRRNGR